MIRGLGLLDRPSLDTSNCARALNVTASAANTISLANVSLA